MVEQGMFFALGFLVAGFIAVLLTPALNQRAERLANRRMRALFPVSLEEMSAERDHLRAEHAVRARKLERKQEKLQEEKAAALSDAGKQLSFANGLKRQLDEVKERLASLEAAHADLKTDYDMSCAELAAVQKQRDAARQEASGLNARRERLEREQVEATRRIDEQREAIAELEARLADADALRAANERLTHQLGVERGAISTLQDAIAGHRANAARASERIAALEKRRDEARDIDRASGQLGSEIRALRERLNRAQEENDGLRLRLAAALAEAGVTPQPARDARHSDDRQSDDGNGFITGALTLLQQDLLRWDGADASSGAARALRERIVDLAANIIRRPSADETGVEGEAEAEAELMTTTNAPTASHGATSVEATAPTPPPYPGQRGARSGKPFSVRRPASAKDLRRPHSVS